MCFYDNDGDWSASVWQETEADSGPAIKCDECGKPIAENEWRRHVFGQEHDSCQICEGEFSDEFISREEMETELADGDAEWATAHLKELAEHKHDYGESFHYDRCRDCDKILQAVEARETDEGCPVNQRRPGLYEMREALWEHEQRKEYAERAISMFPELSEDGFIQELMAVEA